MTGGTPPYAPAPPAPNKPVAEPEKVWVLTDADRCESCVQRAYARVWMSPESYFDLCCHHYRRHKDAILLVAWDVLDETARMDEQKLDASA